MKLEKGDVVKFKDYSLWSDHRDHIDQLAIITDVTPRHVRVVWRDGKHSRAYSGTSTKPYIVEKKPKCKDIDSKLFNI